MDIKTLLIFLLSSKQFSCYLMKFTIFNAFRMYTAIFYRTHRRLSFLDFRLDFLQIAFIGNLAFRNFFFLFVFLHLLSYEHRLFFVFFLILLLSLSYLNFTSDDYEKRSSSFGSSKPKRASFFFLKMFAYTFIILSNLIAGF